MVGIWEVCMVFIGKLMCWWAGILCLVSGRCVIELKVWFRGSEERGFWCLLRCAFFVVFSAWGLWFVGWIGVGEVLGGVGLTTGGSLILGLIGACRGCAILESSGGGFLATCG